MFYQIDLLRELSKCGAEDQHGDNCSVYGASYDVLEIKDPISIVSGTTPVKKKVNMSLIYPRRVIY